MERKQFDRGGSTSEMIIRMSLTLIPWQYIDIEPNSTLKTSCWGEDLPSPYKKTSKAVTISPSSNYLPFCVKLFLIEVRVGSLKNYAFFEDLRRVCVATISRVRVWLYWVSPFIFGGLDTGGCNNIFGGTQYVCIF